MGWTEHYGGRKEGRGRAGQGGVEPAVEMCGFVVRGKQQIRCHRPCIPLQQSLRLSVAYQRRTVFDFDKKSCRYLRKLNLICLIFVVSSQFTSFFLNDLFLYIAIDTVFHSSGIIKNGRRKLLSKLLSKSHVQSSNYTMKGSYSSMMGKILQNVVCERSFIVSI